MTSWNWYACKPDIREYVSTVNIAEFTLLERYGSKRETYSSIANNVVALVMGVEGARAAVAIVLT